MRVILIFLVFLILVYTVKRHRRKKKVPIPGLAYVTWEGSIMVKVDLSADVSKVSPGQQVKFTSNVSVDAADTDGKASSVVWKYAIPASFSFVSGTGPAVVSSSAEVDWTDPAGLLANSTSVPVVISVQDKPLELYVVVGGVMTVPCGDMVAGDKLMVSFILQYSG